MKPWSIHIRIWSPVRAGSSDLGRGRSNERLRSVLSPVDGSTFPFSDAEHCIHRFHLSWESGLSSGSATASKNLESAPRNTWWPRFWLSLIHSFKYPTILMDKWSIITLIILRDVAIPLVPFQRVQAPQKVTRLKSILLNHVIFLELFKWSAYEYFISILGKFNSDLVNLSKVNIGL